jgi:hypothetical protein
MAVAAREDVAERPAARTGARVSTLWVILVLLIAAFSLAHLGSRIWDSWTGYAGYGDLGYVDAGVCGPDGFCRVDTLTPGGAMAVADVQRGDAVRFDRGIDHAGWGGRVARPGEKVGFTLRHGGALSHHVATAQPLRGAPPGARSVVTLATWAVVSLIGLFVVLRSRRRTTNVLLGGALITLGTGGAWGTLMESDPAVFTAVDGVSTMIVYAPPLLFLAFALAARAETSGKASGGWRVVLILYAVAVSVIAVLDAVFSLTGRLLYGDIRAPTAMVALGFLLASLVLGIAWLESRGRDRMRFAFMLVAIVLLGASMDVAGAVILLMGDDWSLTNPLVVATLAGAVAGAAVFAYAVLRHRVFDLGFALNRTLVYGVVSAVLLAAFGVIEWAVNHFVPIEGREKNALIDAVIAVGVFLTFHRVRDWAEHLVERLFYRRWQKAEAAFRKFVREAAFFTEAPALTEDFVQALSAYAEGAPAAVYLADGRCYACAAGDLPGVAARLAADLRPLVSLRADPKPVQIHDDALNAALIAPMVNRNEVIGLAVLGPKPSGFDYRPDEIELIGWATRQVGLDLHALKVERLEASEADLRKTVAALQHALALKSEPATPKPT